jgi:hypothetical protein
MLRPLMYVAAIEHFAKNMFTVPICKESKDWRL